MKGPYLAGAIALFGLCSLASSSSRAPEASREAEFEFARLIYQDSGYGGGRGRGSWTVDMPDAEIHLLGGIRRLTRINAATEGEVVAATDEDLFEYPFLYAVEVGHWYLSDEEAARLREYLLRGGFLMVDDFHGSLEWEIFTESMRRIFPDRPIVDLADTNEVFHVLYDVDQRTQIPNIGNAIRGQTWEKDGYDPYWRGIYDDAGRLVVAINFNMDLGDAWEHADDPRYPVRLTNLAYHFAIDYLLYAMTH